MSRNAYYEINLHITWHVKDSAAVIVENIENRLHHYLTHRALQTPEMIVHAVGGIADHVHLAVSVSPTLLVSEWIGELKGASSHYINEEIANRKLLAWQAGYGVVSFGTKDLPWVVEYVRNQKQHHANGSTQARLERINAMERWLRGGPGGAN